METLYSDDWVPGYHMEQKGVKWYENVRIVMDVLEDETVEVAARQLTHYNIGALPVTERGKLCGVVTDRDLVIRCMAAGRSSVIHKGRVNTPPMVERSTLGL